MQENVYILQFVHTCFQTWYPFDSSDPLHFTMQVVGVCESVRLATSNHYKLYAPGSLLSPPLLQKVFHILHVSELPQVPFALLTVLAPLPSTATLHLLKLHVVFGVAL